MKKVFLFIAAALMSTMMWAETATSTFTDKNWTVGEGEEAWVAAGAATNSFDAQNGRGVQITLKNIQADGLTLTNSSIKALGGISKVELVYSCNTDKASAGTIAVAVGSTAFGEAYTIVKENNAAISFENETPVVDDIVITFTSTQTSKSVYVKSITVTYGGSTPERTLQSIYIAGEATELEYLVGEEFDPAGLKVMGKYDTGDDAEIASGIAWSFDPEVFALGDESVDVTATYKDFTSEVFTVNNIVVTEKPAPVGVAYTKVTADQTDWAGEYIVVYEVEGAARVFTGVDAIENYVAAEIVDNTIIGDFNTVILEATEGGYLVKVNGGDNDGKYISSAGDANELKFNEMGAVMTVSYDTEATTTLIANPAGAVLRYNKTSGQDRFRLYKSTSYTNQQPIQLYKKSSVGPGTGIREAMVNANVRKAMVNGRLIIVKGEKAFDLQGRIVK